MRFKFPTLAGAALLVMTAPASAATLDVVKDRKEVICGVTTGLPGFSAPDDKGAWQGFDAEYCRAVAAAIFDNPDAVRFQPTTPKDRFTALQSGEVDILSRVTTWTFSRDASLGFDFIGVAYYDGQGFMVRKDLGVASGKELDGASVCTQSGSTTEQNLADYFRATNQKYEIVTFEGNSDVVKAFEGGRCEVLSTDRSGLAAQRLLLANPDDFIVLPDTFSKEPLGPVVRQGDSQWADIGRWTLSALVAAEEFGITKANVDEFLKSENPEIRRMLGVEGDLGEQLGLSKDWAYRIIKHSGNYGEIYERTIGMGSPLKLERGINDLWTKGGLQYALPFR
ncbi:amino acid ABC transporter substrate-binding protein [Agaricicola taiwanensis]|uniref:Amino acid ABC transporter substrate-binding protein n=1 Tax=Agaricicola taiwanensis TaxID=591372 RepID=A0A8J2YE64_9RHOB|nr:amino acid ABC transporter substrate-binding protein [Agaricicola taiwanensis]GGE41893.1 amino acid ABC transporter substrate-binding protein [Agaricicola taiwanensis]